jgi:hypothetical protein
MNALETAQKNGHAEDLQRELQELFESQNTVRGGTSIPASSCASP